LFVDGVADAWTIEKAEELLIRGDTLCADVEAAENGRREAPWSGRGTRVMVMRMVARLRPLSKTVSILEMILSKPS
jgi:hypothetical protein